MPFAIMESGLFSEMVLIDANKEKAEVNKDAIMLIVANPVDILKISIRVYNQHIRSVGCAPALVYKLEIFADVIKTLGISTAPSPLFQNNDKRVVVLKNRMINFSLFDTS